MYQALVNIAQESVRQLADMQHSHTRLLKSLVPVEAPAHAQVALSPLLRLANYQQLLGNALTRQLLNCQGLWSLALQPARQSSALSESLAMQGAILQRLAAQQSQWQQGFEDLAQLVGGIRDVNTMSKLMEQEFNVLARLGALLNSQATATMELMESMQIGYGYLLARQEQPAGR